MNSLKENLKKERTHSSTLLDGFKYLHWLSWLRVEIFINIHWTVWEIRCWKVKGERGWKFSSYLPCTDRILCLLVVLFTTLRLSLQPLSWKAHYHMKSTVLWKQQICCPQRFSLMDYLNVTRCYGWGGFGGAFSLCRLCRNALRDTVYTMTFNWFLFNSCQRDVLDSWKQSGSNYSLKPTKITH